MHCIVAAIALALVYGVAANTSATVADSAIYPEDHAPGALRIQTLTGEFEFDPKHHTAPIIIMAYDSNNAALRNMWHSSDSLHGFLAPGTPNDTRFLFLSYAAAAREDMLGLAERLGRVLQGLPEELRTVRRRQLHFATSPLPALQSTSWLPRLLGSWRSPRRILRVQTTRGNWSLVGARLDGHFAFVPSPEGLSGLRMVVVKDACSLPGPPETAAPGSASTAGRTRGSMTPGMAAALRAERRFTTEQAGASGSGAAVTPQLQADAAAGRKAAGGDQSIRGMAALVVQEQGAPLECSYPQLLRKLGHAGAAAAVIGSVPGSDVTEIQCRHEECDWEITVPATMIIHEDAQKIATAIDWFDQSGHDGAQQGVVAAFKTEEVAGNFAGIDASGRVVELGWQVFPTLKQLAWEAQWLVFRAELRANLSRPALVLPVFKPQVLPEPGDLQVNVTIPSAGRLKGLDTLELDFSVSCPGHFDADCPQWDHVLQLHACCGARCRPCRPVVWLQRGSGSSVGGGGGVNSSAQASDPGLSSMSSGSGGACGAELGRWITPFRRREGRWLTDVSELRPLLQPGASCRFTLQAPAWAPGWKPALNLRFSGSQRHPTAGTLDQTGHKPGRQPHTLVEPQSRTLDHQSSDSQQTSRTLLGPLAMQISADRRRRRRSERTRQQAAQQAASVLGKPLAHDRKAATAVEGQPDWWAERLQPFQVLPLWEGGVFDERYNLGRSSINFTVPAATRRVLLEAVITGHGYDLVNLQCAEFCVTSHHFSVNGAEHSVTYREAGTQWGCTEKVRSGAMPNEHGTWQFGRMGWCDGQEVRPWVVDITADVQLPNISTVASSINEFRNTISYRGLFEGQDPQPSKTAGYIMMESNLVFLRDAEETYDS